MNDNQTLLESWKEIAGHLQRDITTVRRWERTEGLPVHRHTHMSRSSVYAYASEIDQWRASRKAIPEPRPLWRSLLALPRVLAFGATLALCLVMVGNGLRPQPASAQSSGISTRQVWDRAENIYGAPSPDGRFLTYIDWATPALAIRDLATGTTRRVIDGSWGNPPNFPIGPSRFSPDGRQVFSAWFNEKEFQEIRVAPVAGGAARVLYSNEEIPYQYPAEWSPDGKTILATLYRKDQTRQIALISVEDGSARVLKSFDWNGPGNISFSPDGRYIAYDRQPSQDTPEPDIFVIAADGSREVLLIQHSADDRLLGWAPDGKHVLFSSDRTGTRDAWLMEVAEGRPNGQPQLIKRDIGRIQPMGFTRNGGFYYGLNAGIRDIYVATLDPTTGKAVGQSELATERFLGSNRGSSWSPDGESLAYFMAPSGNGRQPTSLIVRALKTGQERTLRTDLRPNLNIGPRWSPDGLWLLVNSRDERGGFGLYRVSVQTGAITPVVQDQTARWGLWTPDGKSIVYTTEDGKSSTIRIRNLDSGEDKELFRPEESTFVSNLALSPDGRRLAFGTSTLSQIIAQVLMLMPLEGGTPRRLLGVPGQGPQFHGLDWARDGTHLYFGRQEQMWRISTEGGEPEPVGLQPNGSDGFAISPDGRRVAFITGETKEEVWVMENFLPQAVGPSN